MTAPLPSPSQSRLRSALGRLFRGATEIDFVSRWRRWFVLSAGLILIGLGSLWIRGLNLGIDFEGGSVFEVPTETLSVEDARSAVGDAGASGAKVQELVDVSSDRRLIRVQTEESSPEEAAGIRQALAEAADVDSDEVNQNTVGPSWGEEISEKAARALVVFLIAITIYISLRFEWKMAIPTLVALVHDVLVTIGVYSLTGLEVTPATVVALLTILGYSIYDGIVVFDKVKENTRLVSATNRLGYGEMVNLSLNQTLMRTLNTQITALIPILSLLVVGSFFLGATTLEEFGFALLIGLASGAYSSIFIASPMLALMKEREPKYREIRRRIEQKEAADERAGRAPAAVPTAATTSTAAAVVDDDGEEETEGGPAEGAGAGKRVVAPSVVRSTTSIQAKPRKTRKKGKRR